MGLPIDFAKLKAHDALDIAIYAEQEAEEQYEHFARLMDAEGNSDAAGFFRHMAKLEDRHRTQITERRAELFSDIAPSIRNVTPWGVEVADQGKLAGVHTLRDALLISLEAEARARDYYAAAIHYLTEPQVTGLFEELRASEVEHQRLLKLVLEKIPA